MSRTRLPISPAPKKSPRYPRVGVVWGAFAAGTLSGLVAPNLARADCALPEHTGAVDPGAKGVVKKGKKAATTVAPEARVTVTGGVIAAPHPPDPPRPLGGEPMPVQPPGQMVSTKPPMPPPPVPGAEPPVTPPQGGPVHVTPPQPQLTPLGGKPAAPKPPEDPKKKKDKPHLDGDLVQVGAVRYIHPHGPDEPCHAPDPAGGRLVIKFT